MRVDGQPNNAVPVPGNEVDANSKSATGDPKLTDGPIDPITRPAASAGAPELVALDPSDSSTTLFDRVLGPPGGSANPHSEPIETFPGHRSGTDPRGPVAGASNGPQSEPIETVPGGRFGLEEAKATVAGSGFSNGPNSEPIETYPIGRS